MKQVSEVLKSKGPAVATIGPDATVAAAVAEMSRHNVGALVISSDGRTVEGIVSERDVTRGSTGSEERFSPSPSA